MTTGAGPDKSPQESSRPITDARESALIRAAASIDTLEEMDGFRAGLRDQGVQITSGLYQAMEARAAALGRREMKATGRWWRGRE